MINRAYDIILSKAVSYNERRKLNSFIKRENMRGTLDYCRDWREKWSSLGRAYDVFYRYYSSFIGEDINIVPDDIMHNVIEPLLNPIRFRGYYADKNMFDKLLESGFHKVITPKTIIRCINSGLYDEDYNSISDGDVQQFIRKCSSRYLVAKPTINTSSGKNVLFIDREERPVELDLLIRALGNDFIIQEALRQSKFMAQFNESSVNTLRLNTYKSVNTNMATVINGVIRIGKTGSRVDNLHAGGCLVGIKTDGNLMKFCTDQYGNRFQEFNGINFNSNSFVIPDYDRIKSFAQNVAECIPHQRCLALDIALDKDNNPVLVEYNNSGFSVWVFQQAVGTVFGSYTDEVIAYCRERKSVATRIFLTY